MEITHESSEPRVLPVGPFTAPGARQAGITSWELRQLVDSGQVRRLFHGVYAPSALSDTIELRAAGLALVAKPYTVICDRTAAWMWGVDVLRHWELAMLPRIDAFVLRGRSRLRRPQTRGGERDLLPEDAVTIGDINVTTPLRTSMDLACGLSRYQALAAMDAFARVHGVGPDELIRLLPRYRRRRGVVQARGLVPLVRAEAESSGESFARLAIEDAGLPRPEPQYWVKVGRVPTYRLDLAYPRLKIGIEYDGEEFHSSDEDKADDQRRRRWLRDNGWVVIVVTKEDFRGPALDRWLNELREALRSRMQ